MTDGHMVTEDKIRLNIWAFATNHETHQLPSTGYLLEFEYRDRNRMCRVRNREMIPYDKTTGL